MSLWIEIRDSDGNIVTKSRFAKGAATPFERELDIVDAVSLAKSTSALPLEKREYALRINFEE